MLLGLSLKWEKASSVCREAIKGGSIKWFKPKYYFFEIEIED